MGLASRLLVFWAVATSLAAGAGAELPEAPSRGKRVAASEAGPRNPTLQGRLALSIRDAVTMGIENNLDVEIVRHDPPIAAQEHRAAWGLHDPELFSDFGHASTETPIASALQVRNILKERETSGQAGLRGLLPRVGWEYQLGYGGQRLQTDSSIASLSPEYRASILGLVTIPLLRGAWWGEPWVQVRLTGIASQAALDEFRRALMDIVRDIEFGYWNLAARGQDLEVARKSLETSLALLEQTRTQYEVGVVSRVEVVEAEAGLADREFRLIQAENFYRAAQDGLIDLVLGPFLLPGSQLEIVPSDSPEDFEVVQLDEDLSARLAMEHRPELALARSAEDQQAISLKFAKNQRLPQLDVRGTYGFQGLSGKENPDRAIFGAPTGPLQVDRRFSAAHDDFFRSDGARQWSGTALLSIPLGNVRARASVTAAELELRRARVRTRRVEQNVVLEVRGAIRNLRSAHEGIDAAERRRVASEEQLRAERVRLEYGESTPFNVLLREEDLVDADRQKISALQVYQDSLTALDRAQGTLLRDRNIVVEEALVLR